MCVAREFDFKLFPFWVSISVSGQFFCPDISASNKGQVQCFIRPASSNQANGKSWTIKQTGTRGTLDQWVLVFRQSFFHSCRENLINFHGNATLASCQELQAYQIFWTARSHAHSSSRNTLGLLETAVLGGVFFIQIIPSMQFSRIDGQPYGRERQAKQLWKLTPHFWQVCVGSTRDRSCRWLQLSSQRTISRTLVWNVISTQLLPVSCMHTETCPGQAVHPPRLVVGVQPRFWCL